jgi:Xaa-Pro aminopeptidase
MRAIPLLLLAGTLPLYAQEFRSRREALRKALPDAVVVLFGRTEKESGDNRGGFFQEPNFQYLTGWGQPDAMALLSPQGDTLFLPKRDERWRRYNGPAPDPDDAALREQTGFDAVAPVPAFEARLARALESAANLHAIAGHPMTDRLRALAPLREVRNATLELARLRMKKSESEIELIRRSTEASIEAHLAAWKRAAPGLFEYQAAATFTEALLDRNCPRAAFASIFASGPNALTLHYWRNSRKMDSGDLLLIDAAAECGGYASDLTRTIPVGGKFTQRQRELYEIVLGAQKAAIAAVKPGVIHDQGMKGAIYQAALDYLNAHGKDRQGNPLGRYLTHGISHHAGLNVHDAFVPGVPLEAGMVVSIEPGLYIPEEGIGIRIEDLVLVTGDGAQVLSQRLPKEAAEIEKYLAK